MEQAGYRELHELIQKRLMADQDIAGRLAGFGGRPAVFTPEAPDDQDEGWAEGPRYPRIVFTADLSPDEERRSQGSINLSISAEKDSIFDFDTARAAVRRCLSDVFLVPNTGNPFCLVWNRCGGVSAAGASEMAAPGDHLTGIHVLYSQELRFDLLEYPCQETTDPDPIEAVNSYLKEQYPEALVLWHDRVAQEEEINAARPVFYCRLESDAEDRTRSTCAVAWQECGIALHIFSSDANSRVKYARAAAKKLLLDGELDLADHSPFLVTSVAITPSLDHYRAGQVKIGGRYGVLRHAEKKKQLLNIRMDEQTGGFDDRK